MCVSVYIIIIISIVYHSVPGKHPLPGKHPGNVSQDYAAMTKPTRTLTKTMVTGFQCASNCLA